jgi:hypothetical protein
MRVAPLEGKDGKLRLSDSDWAMQYYFGVMIEPWALDRSNEKATSAPIDPPGIVGPY